MSVFRSIMSRIFGRGAEAAPPGPGEAGQLGGQAASPVRIPPVAQPASPLEATAGPGAPAPMPVQPPPAPVAAAAPVDVEAVLTGLAAGKGQRLDWRHSIVDLMKLLDLDSSLANRKELAEELGYAGPKDGSAEMNLWLHRAVMRRLAEHGGRVPEDLKG
jgi:hypothetical protein